MKALFVAWQDSERREWTPVGRLTLEDGSYRFVYTQGAKKLKEFKPVGVMQDLYKMYKSDELFPIFANRVLAKNRPEYNDYLQWLGLAESSYSALEELARTGGLRATDSLELFPCPRPTSDNYYEVYFFCRGIRHLHPENEMRACELRPGEDLYLMQDLQNSYDVTALLMRTNDPITLAGYAPRYYSADFTKLIAVLGPNKVRVTVEKVNLKAPIQYRVLCKLSSPWPKDFSPCSTDEFLPLA